MTDLPPTLTRLLDTLYEQVAGHTDSLESGSMDAGAWRDAMAATLARGHLAGYMAGSGSTDLGDSERQQVLRDVSVQLEFLDNFALDIQSAPEFQKGWNARAAMYADAVGASYYKGAFKMWPLPAVPRDGTSQCLSRCNCSWEIDELEGEGNADAYWRMGPSEHCQTCQERAQQWAPVQIRNGVVQ